MMRLQLRDSGEEESMSYESVRGENEAKYVCLRRVPLILLSTTYTVRKRAHCPAPSARQRSAPPSARSSGCAK